MELRLVSFQPGLHQVPFATCLARSHMPQSCGQIKTVDELVKAIEGCYEGFFYLQIWVFPKIVVHQNGWLLENPIKIDDLGVPPLFGNIHIFNKEDSPFNLPTVFLDHFHAKKQTNVSSISKPAWLLSLCKWCVNNGNEGPGSNRSHPPKLTPFAAWWIDQRIRAINDQNLWFRTGEKKTQRPLRFHWEKSWLFNHGIIVIFALFN